MNQLFNKTNNDQEWGQDSWPIYIKNIKLGFANNILKIVMEGM